MKPLRLELTAFGSYPGTEVVDFTVLAPRGLFVVTGPTGTGKTTIFDAMCFALYGVMPRKGAGEARSHHADAAAETVVRFEFECDGVRYTATRTPEHERPAKRGGGVVTQSASATVVRHEADGSTTALATSVKGASAVSTELLGLDPAQFQRVVLLPQGDVAQFLNADSKAREELLGQLFGGDVYAAVVDELKQRSTELDRAFQDVKVVLQTKLETAEQQIDQLEELLGLDTSDIGPDDVEVSTADSRDRLGSRLAVSDSAHQALADRSAALQAEATEAARQHQRDLAAAKRFDDHAQAVARLADLELQRPMIEAAAREAAQSAAARSVVAADRKMVQSTDQLAAARAAHVGVQHDLAAAFAELGVTPAPQAVADMTAAVAQARHDQAGRRTALADLDHARAEFDDETARLDRLRDQLAVTAAALAEADQRAESVRARLGELTPALVDLTMLTDRIGALERSVEQRRDYDTLLGDLGSATQAAAAATNDHADLLARFVSTQAPRLAAQLVPGEPCSVCGSTEHPQPALAGAEQPISFDDVSTAAEHRERRVAERSRLEQAVGALAAVLGEHVSSSVDELQRLQDEAQVDRAAAERAHAEHHELQASLAELGEQQAFLHTEQVRLREQERMAEESVVKRAGVLEQARAAAADIDPARLDNIDGVLARLDELCATAPERERSVTIAETTEAGARDALAEALAASPFATVDEARAVVLDPDEEARRLEAASRLRDDLMSVGGALQTLLEQGVPDERPDVEASGRREAEVAISARTAAAGASSAATLRTQAQRSLDEHDRELDRAGAAGAAADAARRAHEVCAKGGALRMSLQRWVLARELDRVTAAANVHLASMTAGRYSLRRQLGVVDGRRAAGLELEVLDAHTGRPRSTSSLSGGEQFQASLALALGLADVVSHGGAASGRVFEALFVDEGFGSLDQDALRDAIDTLHQLRATGRMVGAITHVEAMKQELHPGIEVRLRADGRGSTLVVNP